MNSPNGKVPPNWVTLGFLGDASQVIAAHLYLITALKSCFVAELEELIRRGLLSMCGRLIAALDRPSAASFAIWSASSLPFTLL